MAKICARKCTALNKGLVLLLEYCGNLFGKEQGGKEQGTKGNWEQGNTRFLQKPAHSWAGRGIANSEFRIVNPEFSLYLIQYESSCQ